MRLRRLRARASNIPNDIPLRPVRRHKRWSERRRRAKVEWVSHLVRLMYTTQIENHRPVLLRPLLVARQRRHVTCRCSVRCQIPEDAVAISRASSAFPGAWRFLVDLALKRCRPHSWHSALTRVSGATDVMAAGMAGLGCNRPVQCLARREGRTTAQYPARVWGLQARLVRLGARLGPSHHMCASLVYSGPLRPTPDSAS